MGKTPLQIYKELENSEEVSHGDRSWHVRLLRRMLAMAGAAPVHWMNAAVDVDWHFDDALLALVHAFQETQKISKSESFDSRCWKALAKACRSKPVRPSGNPLEDPRFRQRLSRRIVEICKAAEARRVIEHGDNSGVTVEMIQRHAGTSKGEHWCMAFAWTIVDLAYLLEMAKPPALTVMQKVNCTSIYKWAKKNKRLIDARDVLPGDLLLVPRSKEKFRHVGICVDSPDVNGFVNTVEGNTSEPGNKGVQGIFPKRHNIKGKAFARI